MAMVMVVVSTEFYRGASELNSQRLAILWLLTAFNVQASELFSALPFKDNSPACVHCARLMILTVYRLIGYDRTRAKIRLICRRRWAKF